MSINFDYLTLFMLVFVRLAGMIALNPLFSRRNVPNRARVGLIFFLALLLTPGVDAQALVGLGELDLIFGLLRELGIGLVMGYIFQMFYFMLFFVGDYLDVGFGMSMAKVFDPGTNIQMSMTGNLLTMAFILYFFLTDSHLIMIKLFASSFTFIAPGGAIYLSNALPEFVLELFISLFSLLIRLILPFAVAGFALEVSMGVLMKVIPQITIFVISFQLKLALGMIMLFIAAPAIGTFMNHYVTSLSDALQRSLMVLSGAS